MSVYIEDMWRLNEDVPLAHYKHSLGKDWPAPAFKLEKSRATVRDLEAHVRQTVLLRLQTA